MADAKQGKSSRDDYCNGSAQSKLVLAKPRLGGFGSQGMASTSNKNCNPFGSVLRPPQLKPTTNPFLVKEPESEAVKEKDNTDVDTTENASETRLTEAKAETETPKFIPLGSANVTPRTSNPVTAPQAQPTPSSAGFIFGQNLSARVVLNEPVNNGEASSSEHSSTNGATELLFTSAVASVKESNQQTQDEAGPSESTSSAESSSSLAAAAAEYERSHARPPPPTTNYTTTGEEGETNILQISCRLFAWETGSWRERGRGVLRLNECGAGGGGGARLVARVAGSLRVVLNTKLWPAMVVERAGARSLRLTAADAASQIRLFLVMGAQSDINQLYRALTARIPASKSPTECAQNAPSQEAAERLEAASDDYLDNDELYSRATSDKDRLNADTDEAQSAMDGPQSSVEDPEANVDEEDEKETKSLKRKEPAEHETSPKRQCSEQLIE
ncbi:hypothetical protein ACJJTC_019644 [Scirpophaga incertulas]